MPKTFKTLEQVAGVYKTSVGQAILTGPTRAYKTGNLYNQFNKDSRNSAGNIGFKQGQKFVFRVVVAPDGADYGSYVHNGTRYMDARPFADAGANSPEFRSALNDFMNGKVDEMLQKVMGQVSSDFKKFGFEVS